MFATKQHARFGDHVEYVGDDGIGVYVGMIVGFEEKLDPKSATGMKADTSLPIVGCKTPHRYTETAFRLATLRTVRAPA